MASRFDSSMGKARCDFILESARLFGRESMRVSEVCVEPGGTILVELGMYMDDSTGVVFDGVIDDDLMDDPYPD